MIKNILVNTIEIDKATIREFIKQGDVNSAIDLIAIQANVTYKTARDIVEMFKEDQIDLFDGKDLFLVDYDLVAHSNDIKTANPKASSFLEVETNESGRTSIWKSFLIFSVLALLAFVILNYVVGFNQIGHHISEFTQLFDKSAGSSAIDADTSKQKVLRAGGVTRVADVEDLYPVDTNLLPFDLRAAEIERINRAQLDQLRPAKHSPTDENAQRALIQLTNGHLTDVIGQQKLTVKIGTCYENSTRKDKQACVSCMILLYNREKKNWQEAPNGENFLRNAYDFYLPSGSGQWEASPLSMSIPYDYALVNKYKAME
ncbi:MULTISPECIES: hypothetical protein [unclassified Sphingobacterium]|uniref:hypothetical protein n=1 Tax=unclassified Sphingobacterium TaxID=2609468 RepID=UPI0025E74446|nr:MULTISPECIES: hypothetical protein [unclassified Sphingobacterium]